MSFPTKKHGSCKITPWNRIYWAVKARKVYRIHWREKGMVSMYPQCIRKRTKSNANRKRNPFRRRWTSVWSRLRIHVRSLWTTPERRSAHSAAVLGAVRAAAATATPRRRWKWKWKWRSRRSAPSAQEREPSSRSSLPASATSAEAQASRSRSRTRTDAPSAREPNTRQRVSRLRSASRAASCTTPDSSTKANRMKPATPTSKLETCWSQSKSTNTHFSNDPVMIFTPKWISTCTRV